MHRTSTEVVMFMHVTLKGVQTGHTRDNSTPLGGQAQRRQNGWATVRQTLCWRERGEVGFSLSGHPGRAKTQPAAGHQVCEWMGRTWVREKQAQGGAGPAGQRRSELQRQRREVELKKAGRQREQDAWNRAFRSRPL